MKDVEAGHKAPFAHVAISAANQTGTIWQNFSGAAIANITNAITKQDGDVVNLRITNRQADFVEMLVARLLPDRFQETIIAALEALHEASLGIPRRINQVATRLLLLGAVGVAMVLLGVFFWIRSFGEGGSDTVIRAARRSGVA